jgi:hypothetical protein
MLQIQSQTNVQIKTSIRITSKNWLKKLMTYKTLQHILAKAFQDVMYPLTLQQLLEFRT